MKKLLTILLLSCSLSSFAQTLITDTLFGNGGEIFSPQLSGNAGGEFNKLFKLPNNSLLFCGYYYDISANANYNIMMKTDACGNMDTTFGINGFVKHTFDFLNQGFDYAIQPDGKIVVCGFQASGNGSSQFYPFVARYFSKGLPDTTFGFMGTNKVTNFGNVDLASVFLMPDGKILCTDGVTLMRFDTLGLLDNTFGTSGHIQLSSPPVASWSYKNTAVMRSDSKIVTAGTWYNGSDTYLGILCYDTLGVIDSTFGTNGFVFNTFDTYAYSGWRMLLQSDDKVILAKANKNNSAINIMRYTVNGILDTTFGANGYIIINASILENLLKFDDDKFIVAYRPNGWPSQFQKYTADGIADSAFSINGSNTFQFSSGEPTVIGIASANDELTIGGFSGGGGGRLALTRFHENSYLPAITQTAVVNLHSNVANNGCTYQWYLNGIAIANATDSILTISQAGTYMVEVTNIWGCMASDVINVTNTSINVINDLASVSFYPNPVDEILTINNASSKEITASIFEVSGKLISTQKISIGKNNITTSHLSKGMYILELKGDGVSRSKLVKN